MLNSKKLSIIFIVVLSAVLIFPFTVYSQGYMMGNNRNQSCYNYYNNNKTLTKEQKNKVNKIQEKYSDKIVTLQQKLNSLWTEANNYSSNNDADISKIKKYHQQIRQLRGQVDDLRLDERAEINKVLPKDQRNYFNNNNYNQCYGYNGGNMMNGRGMGKMMGGYGMQGMMNGPRMMSNMMNGSGMGGMMRGYRNNQ